MQLIKGNNQHKQHHNFMNYIVTEKFYVNIKQKKKLVLDYLSDGSDGPSSYPLIKLDSNRINIIINYDLIMKRLLMFHLNFFYFNK